MVRAMEHGKARIWQEELVIPTYELGEEERLPIFYRLRINQGTKGDIYPYKNKDILRMERNDSHTYRALRMENDFIRVTVLPELGGRIYEGYDKINDYNFVYKNNVIKPALIGLNGAWVSGGIEFNWPQHHRPTTFQPVESLIEEEADGSVTAWVGETESKNGQKCLMGVSIHPDRSYITAKIKLYNPTPQKEAFHWWANLAVHVNDSYRLMFPPDIDYITFHDKTHVSPFPIVKNNFAGVDLKDGIDIRYVKNIQGGSSFFIFDSQYSFMAGYDDSRDMGTVHVADRYLSPGKKFFAWGTADYGTAWQKNLTDEDGDYIEIMTGCFTDNQPDFTWIMPYETKTFEQRWYSLKGIRDLKNATNEGAIGVWKDEEGVAVSFNVTAPGSVTLEVNGESHSFDAMPGQVYTCRTGAEEVDQVVARLTGCGGRELVSWRKLPMFFDGKEVPAARTKPQPPEAIPTVDELWIHGMHIEQYKHALIRPEVYYLEGLNRDPGDIRCNLAMGVLMYRKRDLQAAREYLEKAVKRFVSRNPNPVDMECYYQLGLVLKQLGLDSEALSALKRAAWGYAWKSAALQQAAEIDCRLGDLVTAAEDLEASLETNAHSLRGKAQLSAIRLRQGRTEEARESARAMLAYDPLDSASLFTLYLCGEEDAGKELVSILGSKTGAYLDLAETYLSAGLWAEGRKALELCPNHTALSRFYQAWTANQLGDQAGCAAALEQGEGAPQEGVFPNRPFDFQVLEFAAEQGGGALAPYYLGCMYYARSNEVPAVDWWQCAARRRPDFADPHRALAQALFEYYQDRAAAKAEMDQALACSREPRIFYESYQLAKALGVSSQERLAMLESNRDLVDKRQDLVLQYIELLCRVGRLREAKELLDHGAFYCYEGGEGHLPNLHAFVHTSLGMEALKQGKAQEALDLFRFACEYPAQYHEGRRYQDRDAHLRYYLALGYEAVGDSGSAERELREAARQYEGPAHTMYYKALALRKLGDYAAASRIFTDLKATADRLLSSDTMNYFLSFPAALPFEQSQQRSIERMGTEARFFAQLGLGELAAAKATGQEMQSKAISTVWVDYLYSTL